MEETFLENLEETFNRESVKMEDEFRLYPEWDSLALLSLMAMINEEYDITISRANFEECQTLGDLLNLIKQSLNSKDR